MTYGYVAGPMRGKPLFNRPAFDATAGALRAMGHGAFNPAEMDIVQHGDTFFDGTTGDLAEIEAKGFDLRQTLATELAVLCQRADFVCVLPGWEHSAGARAEVAAARAIGVPVAYLEDIDEHGVIRDVEDRPAIVESICEEADRLVSTDRQEQYGRPIDNFTQTGRLWAPILGVDEVTAEQVGLCMIAVKVSRATHAMKRDTLVDIAGYAKTLDLIAKDRSDAVG